MHKICIECAQHAASDKSTGEQRERNKGARKEENRRRRKHGKKRGTAVHRKTPVFFSAILCKITVEILNYRCYISYRTNKEKNKSCTGAEKQEKQEKQKQKQKQ